MQTGGYSRQREPGTALHTQLVTGKAPRGPGLLGLRHALASLPVVSALGGAAPVPTSQVRRLRLGWGAGARVTSDARGHSGEEPQRRGGVRHMAPSEGLSHVPRLGYCHWQREV